MAGILAIEYALPKNLLSNDELSEVFKTWSAEKILNKTGIESRHIADVEETALDLAQQAAEKLFTKNNIPKESIEFILLVTQSPDYILPTSACILQDKLGLRKNIGAYDINLGCSGYIYGLATSKALIESGLAKNVLLITAETYSKHINQFDRSTRTIFGDAAAATLIGKSGIEIGQFDFGTDGSEKDLLMIPSGGMRIPRTEETKVEVNIDGNIRSQDNLYMDGTGIFEFTLREVPTSVNSILAKENVTKDDIDLFVFHQANQFMLDFLRRTMKIDKDKFYMNFSDIGNTVSASIPIALKRAIEDHLIKANQTILLSGFGVGLSWASTILRTGEEYDKVRI